VGGGSGREGGWCREAGEAGSGWEGAQLCGDGGDGSQGHGALPHGDCGEAQPCECGHCDGPQLTCGPLGTCDPELLTCVPGPLTCVPGPLTCDLGLLGTCVTQLTCDPGLLETCVTQLTCGLPGAHPWSQSLGPGPGCTGVEADEAGAASSSVHVFHDCVLH